MEFPRLQNLKYELIRTPLERPLRRLRFSLRCVERWRHPELRDVHLEERRIPALLERLLRPESHCVDIGTHYGSMLSDFCRLAPRGQHVAFEAIPEKARFLRRKFPDVDIHGLALSDHAGQATFYVDQTASGFSSLSPSAERSYAPLPVTCARLDDVLPRERRFDLLKLDVEGAELLVLRGAVERLTRDRPFVLFECGPGGPGAFGHSPAELHHFLTQHAGYAIFALKAALAANAVRVGCAAFLEAVTVYPFQAFNWLAVPAERAGLFELPTTRRAATSE